MHLPELYSACATYINHKPIQTGSYNLVIPAFRPCRFHVKQFIVKGCQLSDENL